YTTPEQTMTVTDNDAPTAITDLKATPSTTKDKNIILEATIPADNVSASNTLTYDIYRGTAQEFIIDDTSKITSNVTVDTSTGKFIGTDTDATKIEGTEYWYVVIAIDEAGNRSTTSNRPFATVNDITAPTVSISPGVSPGTVSIANKEIRIEGSCGDNVKIASIVASYITGGTVVVNAPLSPSTCILINGNYWFINMGVADNSDGSITYTITAYDTSNNTSTTQGVIFVDTKLPTGSLTITGYDNGGVPNQLKTATRTVTLTIPFNGEVQAAISNNIDLSEPTVVNLITSSYTGSWTLTAGDGEKRVYVKLIDGFGNSIVVWDDIVLDTEGADAY
ncbi:MAG: hypothetical protein AAB296_00705, partial [Candidatus Desantisbacteria bacterium]